MLELRPHKCNTRIAPFERRPTVANFANEYSIVVQKSRGLSENRVHGIQAELAGCKSQRRLMPEFFRHRGNVLPIHIRRIADDQVVPAGIQRVEEV